MFKNKQYNDDFHKSSIEGAYKSAKIIVPYLMKLFHPKNVVDFGCGLGAWLQCFKENKVKNILGIDGGKPNINQLLIKKTEYKEMDLAHPKKLPKKFDLAICLEVAEHLPEDSSDRFIKFITKSADILLFSAAVPRQGGTGHINEQFPEYWQKKFANHDFIMLDIIRPQFMTDERIEWWYRQNMFIVMKKSIYIKRYKYFKEYNPNYITLHKNTFTRYHHIDKFIRYRASEVIKKIKNTL